MGIGVLEQLGSLALDLEEVVVLDMDLFEVEVKDLEQLGIALFMIDIGL